MKTRHTLHAAALTLLLTTWGIFQVSVAEERPNILLVVADDMGWTDIGSFGSEIETPNLDVLARRGTQFTDFHTSVSCSPTRSMLLSGTDNHIAGLGNMGEILTPEQRGKPGYEGHLNDRVVSLAEVLRDGGYHTYMAGKWHLGHEPELYPSQRGFERTFVLLGGGASHWPDRIGLMEAGTPAKYAMNGEQLDELPDDFYSSRSYADFLIDSIRENRDDGKPFLAYLAFTSPHDPMHVPEPWLRKYRGRYDDGFEVLKKQRTAKAKKLNLVPDAAPTPNPTDNPNLIKPWDSLTDEQRAVSARAMEVYAGMVSNMDYHFGRVVDFLKDIGEYDNMLIIFLSDNGGNAYFSEDYPGNLESKWFSQFDNSVGNLGHPNSNYAYGIGWSAASSGPLGLAKMTVGEGGIRTPLLITGPGLKEGHRVDSFTYVWDIMPTILELAGITHPESYQGRTVEPMRGRSLKDLLHGTTEAIYGEDEFIAGELQNGKWVRQGNFKAVSVAAPYGDGKWRLYNLADDPGETKDRSAEKPERLKELQAAWDDYAKQVGVILAEQGE